MRNYNIKPNILISAHHKCQSLPHNISRIDGASIEGKSGRIASKSGKKYSPKVRFPGDPFVYS
jgi:hypothetical protein